MPHHMPHAPSQVKASGKVAELFPNMTKDTLGELVVDMTGHEGDDPDAGELGLPFTQTGNNGLDERVGCGAGRLDGGG